MVVIRNLLVSILFSCMFLHCYGQVDTTSAEDWIIMLVEDMPVFVKDGETLPDFLSRKVDYRLISGIDKDEIVYISCWVDKSGKTLDHAVLRGVRKDLDAEALRVARLVQFDQPAKQQGKAVGMKYVIPVKFEVK